jgi:alpha-ketoglutarate-dependent taurine dioxygenase
MTSGVPALDAHGLPAELRRHKSPARRYGSSTAPTGAVRDERKVIAMPNALTEKMFRVRRAAGFIGAYVDDLDLAADLDEATVGALREVLLTHKVLFFRDQRLDHGSHVALGQRFGTLHTSPRTQDLPELADFPQILTISPQVDEKLVGANREAIFRKNWNTALSGWHIDASQVVNPPAIAILRAERVPPFGGDTHWTNLVAAYEGLSPAVRNLCDGLQAEHTFWAAHNLDPSVPAERQAMEEIGSQRVAVHPVVRVHPETGERALFVNPSRTARIMGMSPVESRHLLNMLFEELTRPQYTVRFSWAPGSVAIWDNRFTAHLAATDIDHLQGEDAVRIMHRTSTRGEVPVGPDGFESYATAGQPLDEPGTQGAADAGASER